MVTTVGLNQEINQKRMNRDAPEKALTSIANFSTRYSDASYISSYAYVIRNSIKADHNVMQELVCPSPSVKPLINSGHGVPGT